MKETTREDVERMKIKLRKIKWIQPTKRKSKEETFYS